jgi:hypothetical protein
MEAQLRSAGIDVKVDAQSYTTAVARLHDPEGNPIELRQSAKPGAPNLVLPAQDAYRITGSSGQSLPNSRL